MRALGRCGYVACRQAGSHLVMKRPADGRRLVVPLHDALDTGTLHALLKQAGLSVAEFLAAL